MYMLTLIHWAEFLNVHLVKLHVDTWKSPNMRTNFHVLQNTQSIYTKKSSIRRKCCIEQIKCHPDIPSGLFNDFLPLL